jgi:hypothetical protein
MKKLMTNKLNSIALVLLFSGALASCQKEAPLDNSKKSSPTVSPYTGGSTTTSGTTTTTGGSTTPTGTFNLGINWNNLVDGSTYSYAQSLIDFKNMVYWNAYNTQVSGGALKATLQANVVGTTGGVIAKTDVPDAAAYQLNFDMKFDPNFDFSWGGKVGFGMLLGDGNTGGDPGWDGNGGSFRIMWYKNTSTSPVILKPYVYYKDQPGTYGDDFGKVYPTGGASIQKGVWYNIKMYAKSNTGSNTDGRVQLVINGTTVLDQAIRWTTNDLKRMINNIVLETFRGGSETYWSSPTNGSIYFDNVSYTAL